MGDWDSLVDDLVALGFVDSIEDKALLVGPLGAILTQLTAGGGAKKVNIDLVMREIDAMTQVYDFKVSLQTVAKLVAGRHGLNGREMIL